MANKKLFVGGIAYATTQDSLKAAFEEVGPVEEAVIIMDRDTNKSKGFGFVTMAEEGDVQAAIDRWDGQDLDGRTLTVNEARPKA